MFYEEKGLSRIAIQPLIAIHFLASHTFGKLSYAFAHITMVLKPQSGRDVLKRVLENGLPVYTVAPSGFFMKVRRRPTVFTDRELAVRAREQDSLMELEIRELNLRQTMNQLSGSGMQLCVIHGFDAPTRQFRSVTLQPKQGPLEFSKYLERCYRGAELMPKPVRFGSETSASNSFNFYMSVLALLVHLIFTE